MRLVKEGMTQFHTVGIDGRIALPVGIRNRRGAVVDGIGMAEGIGRHQVETEVEMLLDLTAEGIGVALVGVQQGDDRGVRDVLRTVVGSDAVFTGVRGIHAVDHAFLLEGQVLEEHVVERLGEEPVEGELPATGEGLLETKVGTEDLRILEVAVQGIDRGLAALLLGETGLDDFIIRIAGERELAVCRLIDPHVLGLHAGVVVGIGDQHERDTAGEEAGAAAQQGRMAVVEEPAEAHTRGPERNDLRDDTDFFAGCCGNGALVEFRVLGRIVQQDRDVDAQAVGQGQVGIGFPLILGIETELGGVGGGGPVGRVVGAGHGRVGIPVIERRRGIVEIVVQGSIFIFAEGILQEEVVELVDLVMGTEGQLMLSEVPAEVVRDRIGVGIHAVAAGGVFRADVDGNLVLDIVVGSFVRDVAVVADEDRGRTEHVGDRRGEPGVEFEDEGVGLVGLEEGRIVEIIGTIAGRIAVLVGVHVLVAEHQLVGLVDVPVQAGQDVVGTDVDLVLPDALSGVADLVGLLVEVDQFLGQLGIEVVIPGPVFQLDSLGEFLVRVLVGTVGRGVDVRTGVFVIFTAQEEEQLVLDDRAADGETEGLGELLLILGALAVGIEVLDLLLVARGRADQFLVGVVRVGGTFDGIGTGLGDGVDRTAREAGLAHVERCHDDLDFFDGVQGDRVGVGLAAVGTGTGQAEGIIGHGAVDLEGIVAVVGTGERDAAALVHRRLRSVLDHVVDTAVDGRHRLDHALAEGGAGAGDAGIEGFLRHDRHGVQFVGGLELGVEFIGFTEFQGDVLVTEGAHAEEGDFHGVGTAGTHALDGIAAVIVGDGGVLGAGRGVHGDDGGTGQRLTAVFRDATAKGGGSHLRKGRHRDECCGKDCQTFLNQLIHNILVVFVQKKE